jgi:hypothetical protein
MNVRQDNNSDMKKELDAVTSRLGDAVEAIKQLQDKSGEVITPLAEEDRRTLAEAAPYYFSYMAKEEYNHLSPSKRAFTDSKELPSRIRSPVKQVGLYSPYARDTDTFQLPPYNLAEVITISETESLFSRSNERKISLCMKEGFFLRGKNPKRVQYIQSRLEEIAYYSNLSVQEWVGILIKDLVTFSVHWSVFVRDTQRSSGLPVMRNGRWTPPIAAMFSLPAETVYIRTNDRGVLTGISQDKYPGKDKPIWGVNNFYMMNINKHTGIPVGTPILVPVRDDIAALRRIEEDVEILLYQHLFALYHWKCGTEKQPARSYPDGQTELDVIKKKYSTLPTEGAIVTDGRQEIEPLTAKGAIDALPYLEYFKKRVLAGIGLSSLDIGEGDTSNRSTSDSLSRILVDSVKYIQREISNHLSFHLFGLLMEESPFPNTINDPTAKVWLQFEEVDIDMLIKKRNNTQQLYSSHCITEDEMRQEMGREPLTDEDREKMFINIVGERESELMIQTSAAEAQIKEANRPSNQHGTKQGPDGRKSAVGMLYSDVRTCVASGKQSLDSRKSSLPIREFPVRIRKLDCGFILRNAIEKIQDGKLVSKDKQMIMCTVYDHLLSQGYFKSRTELFSDRVYSLFISEVAIPIVRQLQSTLDSIDLIPKYGNDVPSNIRYSVYYDMLQRVVDNHCEEFWTRCDDVIKKYVKLPVQTERVADEQEDEIVK